MARPRKHPETQAVALRRVSKGESPGVVAADMGIKPSTLRNWLLRGEGKREALKSEGSAVSALQRRTSEGTGIDLTTAVEQATRELLEHTAETKRMIAEGEDAALLRLRLAWEGTAGRTILAAVAVGVPKVTVTSETSVSGHRVQEDVLERAMVLLAGAGKERKDDTGPADRGGPAGMPGDTRRVPSALPGSPPPDRAE